MNEAQDSMNDMPFSEDPMENLKIENEILRLKMQAESGAFFGRSGDLDPAIENEFLKHVQQFETAWQDEKAEKIFEIIGRPAFKKADDLQPEEVIAELKKMEGFLEEHSIVLDRRDGYEPLVLYRFITEELFEHETGGMYMPGMTTHYIYEEFHPNHKIDIEETADRFIKHWFDRTFDEYSWELAKEFVLTDGTVLARPDVLTRFQNFFDCFTSFSDTQYRVFDVHFELTGADNGLGYAEGLLRYAAQLENCETVDFDGPFKLYMSYDFGGWSVFSFVMPGFVW